MVWTERENDYRIDKNPRGPVWWLLVAVFLVVVGVCGWLAVSRVNKTGSTRRREESSNNLKQIGIAMHTYHDANGYFPPADGRIQWPRPQSRSSLSWRVTLLPYLEQETLYREFHLDEPWDSPHNRSLLEKMPEVYRLPGADDPPGYTHYRVFTGAGMFGRQRVRLGDLSDGTSSTFLAAEAAQAVPWTKPDELSFTPNGPLPALGGHWGDDRYLVLLADGSVKLVSRKADPTTLRQMIEPQDGMPVDPSRLDPR